ncbi:MAG: hypothetical protein RIN56_00090 [Sporomusaceae bacterium]|nr:hypothetical protein [Sporomusaceae bacterium]
MGETPVFLSTGLSPSWRASAIACIVFLVVGIGLGAWGMHTWQVSDLRTQLALEKTKPPVVKETVKTETKTQLQYVKGETVYLPAPTPDNPNATQATKLDGKFVFEKPEFIYMVNGKPGRFTKADDERFVFDKNMMLLTQATTIRIEAEIPTIDKTRNKTALLDAVIDIKDKRVHPGASFQYTNKSGFTVGAGATFDGSHARIGAGWSF